MIDVNVNRLDESLKFLEDIIRFSLENAVLLKEIRKTRNDFLKIKKILPLTEILMYRQSPHDLGRHPKFDIQTKKTPHELMAANIARAKQASRTLEEIFKTREKKTSTIIKKIRFAIYDLEMHINECFRRIFNPRLYAILDEKYLTMHRLKEMIHTLERHGATMIQLRIKTLPDRIFYNYAVKIKKYIKNHDIKFIINNRIDIALACRADGVHCGQHDIQVKVARAILGENYIIGASARTIKNAQLAQRQGADYIGVGAVFRTKTKPDASVCGISRLKAICKHISLPIVGIGGITGKNYRAVLRAGASGIAICSYLFEGNVRTNIRSLAKRKT